MQHMAESLDKHLNPDEPEFGFILMVFPLDSKVMSYVSNIQRESVRESLRKVLEQWDSTKH
jgi:hypothetical protein